VKSFKQFLKEQQAELGVPQGLVDKSGVPNAWIETPSDQERQEQQKKEDENMSTFSEEVAGWSHVGTKPADDELEHDTTPEHVKASQEAYRKWNNANHNPHLADHTMDVHDHLVKADPISDPHEKEHINRYTRSSNRLNKHLYQAHLDGEKHAEVVPANDEDYHVPAKLQKAVSKPLTHDLHVQTGVRFHPGEVAAQHPEGHIHLPAFTSTSIHAGVAASFATPQHDDSMHVLHVHLKPGDKARYVAGVSHFTHEKEVTLPMKTTLKVHPKPDVHTDGAGTKVHVWHATVHSQE
jgi:hypothetical protein